ncbi:MAG: midcut-by-XrtH protein [Acidovorax sp.]|uniref:midcut-by-XrtH protein n=1 Tax=Acidovorax sp. TaxID=1872122 RepID=UPI00391D24C2
MRIAARRLAAAVALLQALPAVHAQTITAGAVTPSAIPVDHPGALLLLALAMVGCMGWMLRKKGIISATTLRSAALGAMAVLLGALMVWGDDVQAQLQELQDAFNQPGGQTLNIPVQSTGTALNGSPAGFLPVVFTNQSASSLRITDITKPIWSTCFPLGIPSPLPVTPARPGTTCAVGAVLPTGGACWVDVAALCASAAAAVQGTQPSNLQADAVSVTAGAQATGNVLANDQDPDGPLVLASFVYQGTRHLAGASATVAGHGTLSMQSNGAFVFNAATPFTGVSPLAVTYTVHAGASSTLSITVIPAVPVNQTPVANNDVANVNEGDSVTVVVRANDTDADGDSLVVAGISQGANGSVVIDAITGNPIYTPNAGFVGTDQFTYSINDGHGGTATATVTVTVNALGNRPPVAVNDAVSAFTNTAVIISVSALLSNDTDPDGDVLSILSVQTAVNGSVSLVGGNVVFTPANGYEGSASFSYTVQDTLGATSTASVAVQVASASVPSVVVLKSLLAIAKGTGGTSVSFPITTALVDTDGSETLSIRVSGVPTGASFNAGNNLGGGVWQIAPADLPNLALNLPGSYTSSASTLTVQVISTESANGVTASASSTVTLKADYTTVDVTTTESGNYVGFSVNEHIQGGSGNNIIGASGGNNVVLGGDGDDVISSSGGSNILNGGPGDDTISAGSGTDVLIGGPGNDTLKGGEAGESFIDVFVWHLGDQGAAGVPAVDTILNFSTASAGSNFSGGDVLDLRDLLQGERVGANNGAGNLADYLHFVVSGGSTIIHISHTGGFAGDSHAIGAGYSSAAETQRIILNGVDLQATYAGAVTDQQIITLLLNNSKLIVN